MKDTLEEGLKPATPSMFGIDVEALTLINTVRISRMIMLDLLCARALHWSKRCRMAHAILTQTVASQEKNMEELERQGGIPGVAKLLACELAMGLDQSEHGDGSVESRKTVFGVNKLPDAEPESFWMLMVS